MTLTHRRILYSCFFLIFFITAPIVIFWAEGYRYNFTQKRLQKTGVLFLESKPTDAKIFINNRLQDETTTTRLKNVLPNNYQVKIEKQNYQPWQKELSVYPGQTTFAQYVRLFLNQPEIKNIMINKILLTSQAQNEKIAVVYENIEQEIKLTLLDLENDELTQITELDAQPLTVELSPENSFILIKYADQNLVVDVASGDMTNLNLIVGRNIQQIKWSTNTNDNFLYITTALGLESVNLLTQAKQEILVQSITDFVVVDNHLLTLEPGPNNDQFLINQYRLNNLTKVKTIDKFPVSNKYEFVGQQDDCLNLIDYKNNIFYLIDLKQEKTKIFPDITRVEFSSDKKSLLLGNDFEIYVYDLIRNELNLLVRLGQKIKKMAWYPVPTHVMFLTADNLRIVEVFNGAKQFNTLINQSGISDFIINAKGDELHAINQHSIIRAVIQ